MTQHLSGINRYRRADMARHDYRYIDMGCIDSEIGNERLTKPFTANFAAAYAVCGVVGPMLAQNPLTLEVLTICASSAACSMGRHGNRNKPRTSKPRTYAPTPRATLQQTRRRQCLHC